MNINEEHLLLLREACFAVEKGKENGEEFAFAAGELYRQYRDPYLHPVFQTTIRQTLQNTSFIPD
ncbi:MAG: hypothetical protein K5668_00925 [Lachnospiraceae bacterium]|nr:hypothetical protein [Lachnospiraceae bacterium]